ncbi:MAG: class I SAM-dependent methyltransferase [Alphaproteobacteria bacterium]|nr:class I SAM-dependent methyltransferase [Rhizobiaceae bacterium]MBU3961031.1 class I SAM-dependent methyltransferase [Alphaproteobacteria bacterium]MBU4051079.1 class I SAM-dependent methyltransferase [Alphaproteobacteria bacterium]MBU4087802.1 class I SAM-dependent methyltransferase [Alphaproteobacteria bacterium]MBU4155800.1 class I SAM-dependent methyltransferase [Alphaproteobacteria bacterium]
MGEAERVIGLYERHARAFDGIRSKHLFERPWLDRFASNLANGATVLDIGCGSGEPMAADLIGRGLAVTGVDSSETLIGLCRERYPSGDWRVADMRGLALGRTFDALLAWHSFFHLTPDEQRAMFPVFAAHAADGAMLMFTSGPSEGVAIGSFEGEPLYHASLGPEEYRLLLRENGFVVVTHVTDDPDCGGATIWLARKD